MSNVIKLACPLCTKDVEVSEEDPDATLSEMWNHLYWTHSGQSKTMTNELLALVREVSA